MMERDDKVLTTLSSYVLVAPQFNVSCEYTLCKKLHLAPNKRNMRSSLKCLKLI